MDESSGNALDSVGANDLTATGSPGTASGVVGTSRTLDGSSQFFSHADNATLSVGGGDFTIAVWAYVGSSTGLNMVIASHQEGVPQLAFECRYEPPVASSDRIGFFVSGDGTADAGQLAYVQANNFGSPPLSTWFHVVFWHDGGNSQIGIAINAGTPNTVSHTAGVFDSSADFRVGAGQGGIEYWSGRLNQALLYKRVLTAQERTDLYNGGAGLPFSSFAGGGPFPFFSRQALAGGMTVLRGGMA